MSFSDFCLIEGRLDLYEGVDHAFEAFLFDLLGDVILVLTMGVGSLAHGIGEEEGHLEFHLFQQIDGLRSK